MDLRRYKDHSEDDEDADKRPAHCRFWSDVSVANRRESDDREVYALT